MRRCGRSTWDLNQRRREVIDKKTKAIISTEGYCVPVAEWLLEKCPFAVGQRLWVKEGWDYADASTLTTPVAAYRADAKPAVTDPHWRSPLYMPRWASRLTLEITGVKVERVADISEEDVTAEGTDSIEDFARRWDIINGKKPGCRWADSPFVWAISFRVVDDGGAR